ncbi:MAG: tetratricopeptide repeat protein [Myxococcales bacterium]|nr:tetratricopeptide repeat protein [Myxococcota bacterium]MDW8280494.1 tetratricopeptide repeat protein [Myxococcales bacterium]
MRPSVAPPSPDPGAELSELDQTWKELASQFDQTSHGGAPLVEEAGLGQPTDLSRLQEPGRSPRRVTQAYPAQRLRLPVAQPIPAQLLDALGELDRQDDASRPQEHGQMEVAAGPAMAVEASSPQAEAPPASQPPPGALVSPPAEDAVNAVSSLSLPLAGEVGAPEPVSHAPPAAAPGLPRPPQRMRWLLLAVVVLLGAAALPALRWVPMPQEVPAPPQPPRPAGSAMSHPLEELLALPMPPMPALAPASEPQPEAGPEALAADALRVRLRAVRALLSTHRREAMRKLEALRRMAPHHPEVHIAFGDAALARGQAAQAIGHYQQALRLQPGHPLALLGLARAHAAAGHLRRALSLFETYLRRHPRGPQAEHIREEVARLRTAGQRD